MVKNPPKAKTLGEHPQQAAKGLLSPKLLSALGQLADARRYAEDAQRSIWDFSVEIHTLVLAPNDLRWLICKGYVAHTQETTQRGVAGRSFQPGPPLSFTKRSCFALTDAGLAMIEASHDLHTANGPLPQSAPSTDNSHVSPPLPHWDAERRELRLGPTLVKQFRLPSPNQETILAAFEEEGWPSSLDDPLPPHPEQDSKRRLHETIRSLNCHQKHRLIRFKGNGTGQRILWEYVARGAV